ncbi:YfhO family protein [Streptomyces sp. NPDC003327]
MRPVEIDDDGPGIAETAPAETAPAETAPGEDAPGEDAEAVERAPRGPLRRAPACASLLALLLFCLATALSRSHPFGPVTRNVVDLGQQYLPYHAYWRSLWRGETHGDAFLNWNSGFGSNFLGDIGTYLSSPFDLLVVVFPAGREDLALYVVTAVKIAAAAAAMAALLPRLRPGPWPVAAVLATAYALSGWTLNHGSTVPMWLDGLVAFPLLCLVGEWARTGRRPVLGPVVVALAWTANFYTAYMATVGAALVLAVRLLTAEEGAPLRRRTAGLFRAARSVLIGIGLAAPLVAVVFLATRTADPTPPTAFAPAAWTEVLARFLPATASTASPALFIGTPALLLALTLPFNRAVAPRVRAAWTVAVLGVTLSLQWEPTHLLWHAGASPNGNPYRQTFVLCGLLLVGAWLSVAPGVPRPAALLAGGALLALLAWSARGSLDIDPWTYPTLGVAALLALAAALAALLPALLAGRGRAARALPVLAVALLVAAQAGENAVTGWRVEERQRDAVAWSPRLGPWHADMARAVARADAWPDHRTDPGEVPGGNDALVVGGQGADLYSSLTSETTSRTLADLGFGSYAKGRHPVTLDNPVTDALFSIGTRMRSRPTEPVRKDAAPRATITATTVPVPPLVTVRPAPDSPAGSPAATDPRDSAFRNQELLLGASVYDLPAVRRSGRTVTARCPAGSTLWFWAPEFHGTAALAGGAPVPYDGRPPAVRAPMRALGTVPGSGEVRVELVPDAKAKTKGKIRLPAQALGCLDRARLDAAVRRLTATGATEVRATGHGVTAQLPQGSTGLAVLAVPRLSGWRCAAGDAEPVSARAYRGLVAVPLDGRATSVSCSFRPPGLRLGAAVGGTALLALAATWLLDRRTRGARVPRRGPGFHRGRQEFTRSARPDRFPGKRADYSARRTGV